MANIQIEATKREAIQNETIEVLTELGALQHGHFGLTSGKHSNKYMQCAKLFENPEACTKLCTLIAQEFNNKNIELVVGPAVGGIIMCYEVARLLGVRNIFAEREKGIMTFRRGFKVAPNTRVLVVEDVVTTGGSVKEVIALLDACKAVTVGIASVVDRTGGAIDFGNPYFALMSTFVEAWETQECPLCKEGVPIHQPGSRFTNL